LRCRHRLAGDDETGPLDLLQPAVDPPDRGVVLLEVADLVQAV
jgi:hypothetical protein